MSADQVVHEYKVRAGALTLSYLNSTMGWDGLRAILAQAATGVDLVDIDAIVLPDRDEAVFDTFADRYLLEPANPDDDPDDIETKMRPTPAGREVPLVGTALHQWCERCPRGPVTPGEDTGDVLWPLLCGWVSTVVHAIAAQPRSVAEVQEEIGVLPLELVEANLGLLEEVELIRPLPPDGSDGEQRFEPTEWLRHAVAPLVAAARLELRHPRADTAPIAAADVEAILGLALPLVRMPSGLSGSCSLSVELDQGVVGGPVGVTARIEENRIVACQLGTDPVADAWVEGSTGFWLDAVIEGEARGMPSGGDRRLPRDILNGLHKALFGRKRA
jgi:hypothetical protein